MIFPTLHLSNNLKEKKKKRNINIDLAVLPSHNTMPIIFMLEMVLSHLFSMVESCFSSLLLMYRQIVSRRDLTGLGHINILLGLSFTRDYRMLLYIVRATGAQDSRRILRD